MSASLITRVFGSRHDRTLAPFRRRLPAIRAHAATFADRPDAAFADAIAALRDRVREVVWPHQVTVTALEAERQQAEQRRWRLEPSAEAEQASLRVRLDEIDRLLQQADRRLVVARREALDAVLVETYGVVLAGCERLVGRAVTVAGHTRTWDLRPYDVQMLGAMALAQGMVAEIATGEGKTLVAAFPLVLHALTGLGAHLVTANPYLAQRDSEWMGALYELLGLRVQCLERSAPLSEARQAAYRADITYGTTAEFGFDYLRDHMIPDAVERVQRGHAFALVDEVDAILIDEARTPLVISGPTDEELGERYRALLPAVTRLVTRQTRLVAELCCEAEEAIEAGHEDAAVAALLAVRRGMPDSPVLASVLIAHPGLRAAMDNQELWLGKDRAFRLLDDRLCYVLDLETRTVHLTEQGLEQLETLLGTGFALPDLAEAIGAIEADSSRSVDAKREAILTAEARYAASEADLQAVQQLLRAATLFRRDRDYIVQGDAIAIVDPFTGRVLDGRRWSKGLHQAVEATEGVSVTPETQVIATTTIQHYFRLYDTLAGMTGTAETDAAEFAATYGIDVVVVPTHRPVARLDRDDLLFQTIAEKYAAVVQEVRRLHALRLPVLIGTTSVEQSERLAAQLRAADLAPAVLNAKQHATEAEIIARAGQPGAITIATNMAGRGTDILLHADAIAPRTIGWCLESGIDWTALPPSSDPARQVDPLTTDRATVLECGGLHVIGTERHESRRIDRQLRGRSGRQGDPGASQFFLSLADELIRPYVSPSAAKILALLGQAPGVPITHPVVRRVIGEAQRQVEIANADARRHVFEYDTVLDQQRQIVYALRDAALDQPDALAPALWDAVETTLEELVAEYTDEARTGGVWDFTGLRGRLLTDYALDLPWLPETGATHAFRDRQALTAAVVASVRRGFAAKRATLGEHEVFAMAITRRRTLDAGWLAHLADLERLRETIQYRSAGGEDPVRVYALEAYELFAMCMDGVRRRWVAEFFGGVVQTEAAA